MMNAVPISVGARVELEDGMIGTVVCNIDSGEVASGYPLSEWKYLGTGLVVMTDEIGLVHYDNVGCVVRVVNVRPA